MSFIHMQYVFLLLCLNGHGCGRSSVFKKELEKKKCPCFFADGKAERIGIPAKNYGHVHKGVSMFEIG